MVVISRQYRTQIEGAFSIPSPSVLKYHITVNVVFTRTASHLRVLVNHLLASGCEDYGYRSVCLIIENIHSSKDPD